MELLRYLNKRHDMITEAIASEMLAGNAVKETNERHALAEIEGVMDSIRAPLKQEDFDCPKCHARVSCGVCGWGSGD